MYGQSVLFAKPGSINYGPKRNDTGFQQSRTLGPIIFKCPINLSPTNLVAAVFG